MAAQVEYPARAIRGHLNVREIEGVGLCPHDCHKETCPRQGRCGAPMLDEVLPKSDGSRPVILEQRAPHLAMHEPMLELLQMFMKSSRLVISRFIIWPVVSNIEFQRKRTLDQRSMRCG
jgi:hypothetical protein